MRHQAVISIRAEVMEMLDDGRVTGVPKHVQSKVVTVTGDSQEDCENKVTKLFKKVKNAN